MISVEFWSEGVLMCTGSEVVLVTAFLLQKLLKDGQCPHQ